MVADPFHLLDCAMTSEGGCGLVLDRGRPRRRPRPKPPVYVLGGNIDHFGPVVPATRRRGTSAATAGPISSTATSGRRGRGRVRPWPGSGPTDVDVCEFYDPFSFEIIRQFEAFGFCGEGEGGDFVMDGTIEPGGRYPITTDGGMMSFSHGGAVVQMLQRVIRGVQQLRGDVRDPPGRRAPRSRMCTNGGAGALFTDVLLLGEERTMTLLATADRRDPAARTRAGHASRTGTAARAASCCSSAAATVRPRHAHARVPVRALHVAGPHAGSGARARARSTAGPRCGVRRLPSFTVPYVAIIVDMDEGWQILSNLIGCEHDAVRGRHAGRGRVPRDARRDHAALLPSRRLTADRAAGTGGAPRRRSQHRDPRRVLRAPARRRGRRRREGRAARAVTRGARGRREARRSIPRTAARCSSSCTTAMRSVVGRPGDPEVEALVAGADVVIESFPPSKFDPQVWLDAHPGLIVCSITPYGRTGPYAERPTTEFIVQAESGGLVGRGSVRERPVPGRRAHQRVAGGHVLGDGGRGGRATARRAPATVTTSTSRWPR